MVYILLCYFFIINDWKFLKQTRPYKTISNLTDKDFFPVNRRQWHSITINLFPMYINIQQQIWFKNVQHIGVSAMMKAAAANTCISVISNQSYLGIRTLPNKQPHGRYKTDASVMKSINHDQIWRQKSHEMFATKWLKSSVAATTQLFHISKSWSVVPVLLEMPTKSRRSLYRSCWVTWVPEQTSEFNTVFFFN